MISVDNFYWILDQNLIRPCGLNTWYYYPWGTQKQLCKTGLNSVPRQRHHVLFYFDQEPLWTDDFGSAYDFDDIPVVWSNKVLKILANSEQSVIKKKICQDRSMLDFYFFYHGFAALDWFRDSQYITANDTPTKVFCSYNHLCTELRSYRMALTARLIDMELHRYGDISLHATKKECEIELSSSAWLSKVDKMLIKKNLYDNSDLPITLDSNQIDGRSSAAFGINEYKLWQRSLVHLVNETVFYHDKLHLTEKIFKPIVALRPFILVGAPGNLKLLRNYGFQTFSAWIDESYDDITDSDQRLYHIALEVSKLCAKSQKDLQAMFVDMQSVLYHNKQHFFGEFRKIIVDELVDNFDTCIRIWNHGRPSEQRRPLHPDLQSVKNLMLS